MKFRLKRRFLRVSEMPMPSEDTDVYIGVVGSIVKVLTNSNEWKIPRLLLRWWGFQMFVDSGWRSICFVVRGRKQNRFKYEYLRF